MPLAVLTADRPLAPPPPLPMPPWTPGGPSLKQQATCPTCGAGVASLLAGCDKRECRSADLDYDAALERLLNP